MTGLQDPADWLGWWSELWHQAYGRTAGLPSLAPQVLSQPILPGWMFAGSVNVTEENSSSPETEREIVSQYSYGRQLGRITGSLPALAGIGSLPMAEDQRARPQARMRSCKDRS